MRYSPFILVLLVVTSMLPLVQAQGTFWLSGWDYRVPFTLTANYNDVQANFTLTVPSTYYASIRVTEDDGVTLIPVWNDSATNIWARFPYANQTYYLYYGNSDAAAVYDATTVFQRVISSGVTLSLPVNEGSGNTVTDYSGNSGDGTITGADWITTGKYGNALDFVSANNDFVTASIPSIANGTTVMVMLNADAWVHVMGIFEKNQVIRMAKRNAGADEGVYMDVYVDGNWRNNAAGDFWKYTTGLTAGTYHSIAYSYNASTHKIRTSVDGTLLKEDDLIGGLASYTVNDNANGALIGKETSFGFGNEFNGVISYVLVFNYALSEGEVSDLDDYYPQCSSGNLGKLYLRRWSTTLTTVFETIETSDVVEANNNILAIGLLAVGAAFTFTVVMVKRRTN